MAVPQRPPALPTSVLSAATVLDGRTVEAVASRVAELVRPPAAVSLVDAREIARRFGVHRSWVYAHAEELGAVRLGDGPKARLRFDLHRVAERLTRDEPTMPDATPPRRETRVRRPALPAGVELIHGRLGR